MAEHPKMFISSAVVMPPQSQNPGQNLKYLKNLNKEQRTKNKEQRTKNKEQRTKNKGQRTKNLTLIKRFKF